MIKSQNVRCQGEVFDHLSTHHALKNSSRITSIHVNKLQELILKDFSQISQAIYDLSVNVRVVRVYNKVSNSQVSRWGIVTSVYTLHLWELIPNNFHTCQKLLELILENSSQVSRAIYDRSVNGREIEVECWVSKSQVSRWGIVTSIYSQHLWELTPNNFHTFQKTLRTHPGEFLASFPSHIWPQCQ